MPLAHHRHLFLIDAPPQTYTMWWAPDFVCNMTVFVFTLAWGGLVFLVSWAGLSKSAGDSAPGAAAIVALVSVCVRRHTPA